MTDQITDVVKNEEITFPVQGFVQIVNLIDTVTERGAFKGPELLGVGAIREEIVRRINASQAKVESAPPTTETPAKPAKKAR